MSKQNAETKRDGVINPQNYNFNQFKTQKILTRSNISPLSIPTLPLIDWQTPLNDYKTLYISLGCVMTLIQYDLCPWLRSQRKHDEYLYPLQVLNARVPIN